MDCWTEFCKTVEQFKSATSHSEKKELATMANIHKKQLVHSTFFAAYPSSPHSSSLSNEYTRIIWPRQKNMRYRGQRIPKKSSSNI